MSEVYDRQRVLDSLRTRIPELSNYTDDTVWEAYTRKQELSPTGLPTIKKKMEEEPPIYKPISIPEQTSAMGRFGKRFVEAAVPFGLYEPELEEAEGFTEQFAGAMGSGFGFFAGALPITILTGGVSVPLKSAQAVSRLGKIVDRAKKAELAGKKGYRTVDETLSWIDKFVEGKKGNKIKNMFPQEAMIPGTGLLGRSDLYRRGMQSLAYSGRMKTAKALDMGIRNLTTFSLYGQTHMKPNSPLEQRWESLKADVATAGLFTGLGTLSTRVLFHNGLFGVKSEPALIAGETALMGIAGAYMSDMGQTEIPFEERLAHGVTLSLMHLAGIGLDKKSRKKQQVNVLMQKGMSLEQAKRLVYKSGVVDDLDNVVIKFMKDSESLFVDNEYIARRKKSHLGKASEYPELGEHLTNFVEIVNNPRDGSAPYVLIEHFKPKNFKGKDQLEVLGEPKLEKIRGEEVKDSLGNVVKTPAENALDKFNERFVRFRDAYPEVVPEATVRKAVPEGVTEQAKVELEQVKAEKKDIERFIPKPGRTVERAIEIVETPIVKTKGDIIPKTGTMITQKESIQMQIDQINKRIENLKWVEKNPDKAYLSGELLFNKDVPWHLMDKKDIMALSLHHAKGRKPVLPETVFEQPKWQDRIIGDMNKLKGLRQKLKTADGKNKTFPIAENYELGDWVRIPLYLGDGKYSLTEASLGRYEGKYGELTEGKYPTFPKEEINTRGLDPRAELNNADVFSTITPQGIERLEKIAVRPMNAKAEMAPEFKAENIKLRYLRETNIKKLDATPADSSIPKNINEISVLDALSKDYKRFSLPKNLTKGLPENASASQKTMIKRIESAGLTPKQFLNTLKKDGIITITTKEGKGTSYTYRYGGEKSLQIPRNNISIQQVKEGPSAGLFEIVVERTPIRTELLKEQKYAEAARSDIKQVLQGNIISVDKIGNVVSSIDWALEGGLGGSSLIIPRERFGQNKPVQLSASQVSEAVLLNATLPKDGYKMKEIGKRFKTKAEAEKALEKYLKSKHPVYEEFYIEPKEITKGTKYRLVEERVKDYRRLQEDYKEAREKGGEIYEARIAEESYNKGISPERELASAQNLSNATPYNPSVVNRLSDILNINFGKPVKLRLTKLDRRGNKQGENRDFKYGNILSRETDFALGFDTRRQAKDFADKYWLGEKAGIKLSELARDRDIMLETFGKSPEFIEYSQAKRKASNVLNKAGIPINPKGYQGGRYLAEVLDTFFPQANRDFNNLNTSELNRLSGLFRRTKDVDFLPEQVDVLSPDNLSFSGEISRPMMKLVQSFNPALPIAPVLDTAGSFGRTLATRGMLRSSIERKLKGLSQEFSENFFKRKTRLKEKDMDTFLIEIDSKFKEMRLGSEHIKEVERLQTTMIDVKLPLLGKDGKTTMVPERISLYDYGTRLIRDFYDLFAISQANYGVEVFNAKTNKKTPYLEVLIKTKRINKQTGKKEDIVGKAKIDTISPTDVLLILKKEKGKGKKIEIATKKEGFKKFEIAEVSHNAYKPDFFHRVLTPEFWDLVTSKKADGFLLNRIIANDPILRNNYILDKDGNPRKATRTEVLEEASKYLDTITDYAHNTNKIVDGQIFSRVANISPYIYYGKDGILIEPAKYFNKEGKPFKVGDKIEKINGEKDVVTKAIQTYSTNAADIINKYTSKASKSAATYGAYEKPDVIVKTPTGEAVKTGSRVLYEIERMKMDVIKASKNEVEGKKNAEFYENLVHRMLNDHIRGRDYNHPYLGETLGPKFDYLIGKITRGSSAVGLSFPISAYKNLILGQGQLAVLSSRELMKTWYKYATDKSFRKEARDYAVQVGANYSGNYDLFIKPTTPLNILHSKSAKEAVGTGFTLGKELLITTGGMRPTEMFNRTIASVMGTRMLDIHLDNMNGVKNFSTKGVPFSYSRSILENVLRFSPKEIDSMLKMKKAGGSPTEKQKLWAADRAHTVTQGIGDLPYIPYWMGNKGWKPLTLFYRIAYRMTDNIANNVIKPAYEYGNIWPAMKYIGMSVAAGESLYALYWYAFGEERKNKLKDAPAQFWSNFIRAEGLGIMSNAFDEYGNSVSDAYTPVVFRNMTTLTNEALHIMRGEKTVKEGVNSGLKRVVALYNGSRRVVNNMIKDTEKRVTDSKRRQSQFLDVYFPDYNASMDEGDYLTKNSPYYQSIRDAFWTDDPKLKADTYEVALNYLTDVIIRDNAALARNPMQARKQAKARIKNIISRMQPIPSSWRDRKKGDRFTKYNLYMSKLTPEQIREEKELETLFKQKKADFWRSTRL
tara:strand:+ start:2132 stop:8977 length:6846 start_codon:yes stop_codon:yes gene_type:complete